MSPHDRTTPKEIKEWCEKLYDKELEKFTGNSREFIVTLMFKSHKRGYNDALSG